jgi:hypothetical protein
MPTMPIPEHWSAQQALAVYEFVDELRELIWLRYGPELHALMQAEQETEAEDFDDDDMNF